MSTAGSQLRAIFVNPIPLKILLLCVPIAIFSKSLGFSDALIFATCFLSLVPLAGLLGDFTEDLALRSNDVIGALLNVTFGNATELIISICALRAGFLGLIKLSLIGSILGNMLLVLGTAFFVGGMKRKELHFNSNAVNTYAPLLLLSMLSFVIPGAYSSGMRGISGKEQDQATILFTSRRAAIVMTITYVGYLIFQLVTHKDLFDEEASDDTSSTASGDTTADERKKLTAPVEQKKPESAVPASGYSSIEKKSESTDVPVTAAAAEEEEGPEEPQFSFVVGIAGLLTASMFISYLSDLLVDSIKGAAEELQLSHDFIGIILVPIVGNVAEHASAVIMAMKGKLDIAVGVAMGSSIQIAMFVMPVLVLVAWMSDIPLDMDFHPFLTAVLVVSVLVVNNIISDGKSNWLEGMMLVAGYCMIAITFVDGSIAVENKTWVKAAGAAAAVVTGAPVHHLAKP